MGSGRPLATVWFDSKPVTMLVDTGAGLSSLSPATASRLGLTNAVELSRPVVGFSGVQTAKAVIAPHMRFGQIALQNQSLAVVVSPKEALAGEPDGALGIDVLSRYEIDLDLPHSRIGLYAGQPCKGLLPGWVEEDAIVPFTPAFRVGRQIAIPITIQGTETAAVVDTGADDTLVDGNFARRLGIGLAEFQSDLTSLGAGPRMTPEVRQRFTDVRIGAEQLPPVEAAVLDLSRFRPKVFLGDDYLRTHKVWISYATGQVHTAHTW
jgi:predicted aspartyl protease